MSVLTACSQLRKVLFLALSVTFLFVHEISPEPLNGFAPNSHGSLVPHADEFECQGQRSRSPGIKMTFFGPYGGVRAVYVW